MLLTIVSHSISSQQLLEFPLSNGQKYHCIIFFRVISQMRYVVLSGPQTYNLNMKRIYLYFTLQRNLGKPNPSGDGSKKYKDYRRNKLGPDISFGLDRLPVFPGLGLPRFHFIFVSQSRFWQIKYSKTCILSSRPNLITKYLTHELD